MGLIKNNYICPFCFEHNSLYKVHFRCKNHPSKCPPEPDQILADFLGKKSPEMKPRVIEPPLPTTNMEKLKSFKMPREINCPHCKAETNRRICPSCHWDLPLNIGEFPDLIIAVIGGKDSGKSHYIAVLIEQLKKQVSPAFNCLLGALNDITINRYREQFYDPIYKKNESLKGTAAEGDVKFPLIYSLTFMKRKWYGKEVPSHSVTLVFFDTAGESLNAEDTMAIQNKYIYNSSGIILLLDPLQLKEVRDQISDQSILPSSSTEIEDIIDRTSNLIRHARGMKQNTVIDIPISVAFSKVDMLQGLIDSSSCLNYPSKHVISKAFDLQDFQDVNAEMESMISAWSGDFLKQQLKVNFKTHAFFGLSALGCKPDTSQKIPKLRPTRVEDPLLWLLWENGIIKKKRK